MDKRQFTGKTLDEALDEASNSFSINKDLLCYNVIQQPSTGLFSRFFFRSIRIEAWVETAKEDLQAAAREVVRQTLVKNSASKANLSPVMNSKKESYQTQKYEIKENKKPLHFNRKQNSFSDQIINRSVLNMESEGVRELFENFSELFFAAFGIPQENIETIIHDNDVVVRVSNPEIEEYLCKSDKLSLAFEHVFKRVAQKKLGDISSRISLDAGESSEKREERLIGMARSLAEKVKKTGKSAILSSKSSQERRVIHLALDGFIGVATRSVGTGDKRRLVIYSTDKNLNISKLKNKSYKKRSNHNTFSKQNNQRVGAFSYNDSSEEDDIKKISNKRNMLLNKEN